MFVSAQVNALPAARISDRVPKHLILCVPIFSAGSCY
jgi:hypothetical protein